MSLMCFKASSRSTSPVGASDLQITCEFQSKVRQPVIRCSYQVKSSQVKFICIAHFMYKTIQCFTEIKALQQGAEKVLKICKIIEII